MGISLAKMVTVQLVPIITFVSVALIFGSLLSPVLIHDSALSLLDIIPLSYTDLSPAFDGGVAPLLPRASIVLGPNVVNDPIMTFGLLGMNSQSAFVSLDR